MDSDPNRETFLQAPSPCPALLITTSLLWVSSARYIPVCTAVLSHAVEPAAAPAADLKELTLLSKKYIPQNAIWLLRPCVISLSIAHLIAFYQNE